MRTDIHLKLKCSACDAELEADLDRSKNGISADSAFHMGVTMFIHPCPECLRKAREPLELMKKALSQIS